VTAGADHQGELGAVTMVVLFCVLLAGCDRPSRFTLLNTVAESISIHHDDKRGVTCWVFQWGNRGGLSCLPDSALRDGGR
jgi:hypothetical protein